MKTFIKLALVTNLALFAVTPAFAGQTLDEWMDDYYSPLDESTNCRYTIGGQSEEKYCMKVKKAEQIDTIHGERLYLLMTGDSVESHAHVAQGAVGMFIFAPNSNNTWKVISAKPKIAMGWWGQAPTDWTFHKFAPNKWGFLTTTGYLMGGQFSEGFNILIPNGQSITHSDLMKRYSYDDCEVTRLPCYDLSAKLKINHNEIINGHYPLILTVNGYNDRTGKKYKNRKYQAIYKKGKGYTTPRNYPISME